ncbi:MAG: lysophospholipid acyltransferase family protein [Candidatus Angelobacter sp.]
MPIHPIRRGLRVARRFLVVAFCICACLTEYLIHFLTGQKALNQRTFPLHRWSAVALRWLGVKVVVQGVLPEKGLVVSNHLSYLDILVFSAVAPCAFVAKREIRSWPGVGWIATLAGTIYIDRSRRSATHWIQPEIAAALAARSRLVIFPEGTSSDGKQILPFRSSLLQPAIENRTSITAASLSYEIEDGDPAVDVCYWGNMKMAPHALKLFGKNGVTATLRFGGRSQVFTDRKEAVRILQKEVTALKGLPT